MSGGGGGSSNQTTTSTPWSAAQPNLKYGLSEASRLYKKGIGDDVYTGSRVAAQDASTKSGLSALTGAANSNLNGRGLSGQAQGVINAGGYNSAMRDALGGFTDLTSNGGLSSAQQQALNNSQTLANSTYSISPEVQQALDYQTQQALGATNAATSAAGRYGSASQANAMARAIGNVNNDVLVSDIRNWQGRKDAANQNLFNMGQAGQQNLSGAYSNIANLGQTAFGNLGSAYDLMLQPGQTLGNVGAQREAYNQRLIDAKIAQFDEKQNRPWEQLSRFNAISSGAGGLGGTSTQSGGGQSNMMNLLGYGLTGAGLLGGFL